MSGLMIFLGAPPFTVIPVVLREALKNKIEIRPIDALFEVLGITTFLIYLVLQFE